MGGTSYIRKHCLYNYARTRGSTIAACDFHLDFTPARLFASTYPRFFLCKALRQPVARLRRRRASAAPVSIVSMAIHTPPNQPIFLFLKPSKTLFFHPAVSFFKPVFFSPHKHLKSSLPTPPGNLKLREKALNGATGARSFSSALKKTCWSRRRPWKTQG